MSELKKLIDECEAAEAAAGMTGEKLPMLTTKFDAAERQTQALNAAVDRTEQAKDKALSDFVLDKATEEDVQVARENHEAALQALKHNEELIGALARQIAAIEEQTPHLVSQAQQARRRVFKYRYDEIVAEAKSRLGDLFTRAYACRLLSGGASQEGTAKDITQFNHMPDHEAVKRIQAEIQAEIFGEQTGKQNAA